MDPDFSRYQKLAAEVEVVPVWIRTALDQETPVTIFRKLVGKGVGFLLESMAGGEDAGRFSIIGAQPLRTLTCSPAGSVISEGSGVTPAPVNPFEALRQFVPRGVAPEGLRFAGGAVGYMGYDAVRHLYDLPGGQRRDPDLPDAQFMECGLLVVLDHLHHQMTLIAPTRPAGAPSYQLAYEEGRDRLRRALRRLGAAIGSGLPVPVPDDDIMGPDSNRAVSSVDQARFMEQVDYLKQRIAEGRVAQVVISRRFEFPVPCDSFDLYRALRVINPSPYMFYLRFNDDTALVGASPELLVRVTGDQVLTRPLAGTRRRGTTPHEDRRLEAELLADAKERAEHMMLVDLGRADLGQVGRYGSVRVERLMYVERYSHVMHLASDVVATLAAGRDAVDALAACFPAGTLSGAPKLEALRLIDELEPLARGPYGGAVGYLGYSGDLDMCIAIRTILVHRGRGYLQAGAGIVADSDAAAEYAETEAKARSGLRALALAARIGRDLTLTYEAGVSA